jgi:hypothetical protein
MGGSWGTGANGVWGVKLWRVFLQGAGGAALIDVGGERRVGSETLASFPAELGAALIN